MYSIITADRLMLKRLHVRNVKEDRTRVLVELPWLRSISKARQWFGHDRPAALRA